MVSSASPEGVDGGEEPRDRGSRKGSPVAICGPSVVAERSLSSTEGEAGGFAGKTIDLLMCAVDVFLLNHFKTIDIINQ